MKPSPFNTSGLLSLLLSFTLLAASAQKVSMAVEQTIENRVGSESGAVASNLTVSVKVSGLKTDAGHFFKIGEITRAVDNLGNTVTIDEWRHDQYTEENTLHLRLISAERKATEISVLEGTLKYFNPTVANKGLVNVDKPADKLGTNLLKGKYSDIALVLLDRKKLQELKAGNDKAYRQQLDKLKKEYGPGAESIGELEEVLEDPDFGYDNEVFIFFHDPKNQIVNLIIRNAADQWLSYGNTATENHISFSLGDETFDNTLKIELNIENPQSMKEYPFTLKNIILP